MRKSILLILLMAVSSLFLAGSPASATHGTTFSDPIPAQASNIGTLNETGESLFYSLYIMPAGEYNFTLVVPAGVNFNLYLYEPSGTPLMQYSDNPAGVNEEIIYTITDPENDFNDIIFEVWSADGSGEFELLISPFPENSDDGTPSPGTTFDNPIQGESTNTGTLNASDERLFYQFNTTSEEYLFNLSGTDEVGKDYDMYLYDPSDSANPLSSSTNSSTIQEAIKYTFVENGTVIIEVVSVSGSGDFILTAEIINPEDEDPIIGSGTFLDPYVIGNGTYEFPRSDSEFIYHYINTTDLEQEYRLEECDVFRYHVGGFSNPVDVLDATNGEQLTFFQFAHRLWIPVEYIYQGVIIEMKDQTDSYSFQSQYCQDLEDSETPELSLGDKVEASIGVIEKVFVPQMTFVFNGEANQEYNFVLSNHNNSILDIDVFDSQRNNLDFSRNSDQDSLSVSNDNGTFYIVITRADGWHVGNAWVGYSEVETFNICVSDASTDCGDEVMSTVPGLGSTNTNTDDGIGVPVDTNDAPGFALPVAILAVISISVIIRRRQN